LEFNKIGTCPGYLGDNLKRRPDEDEGLLHFKKEDSFLRWIWGVAFTIWSDASPHDE
jgi:hypothetical protein